MLRHKEPKLGRLTAGLPRRVQLAAVAMLTNVVIALIALERQVKDAGELT